MSYDLPSGPPPSGPPPGGRSETLDSQGGDPAPRGRGRRTGLLVGGAVLLAAAGGAAAWAAMSFFSTGDQPAQALPASTLAYASIDLDPSGGQKIAAMRTLSKFPAFDDAVGLDADDDVRKWVFEEFQGESDCDDLDYADDVAPWLGDRFAMAAVDTGGDTPAPVIVLQVSDDDAAEKGLRTISECSGGEDGAWSVGDGWALIAETQEIVDDVAADAAEASLADDDDFQHWTGEAGDSGIVMMYAAPEAGAAFAEELAGVGDDLDMGSEAVPDETVAMLEEFDGAAATIRFDGGGLELELAVDAGDTGRVAAGDAAGDVVASLPEGTVAALGLSMGEGWFDDLVEQIEQATGESREDLIAQANEFFGLDLPDDAETLVGDALALAVDGDFDPEEWFSSLGAPDAEPTGLGVKILGDPDAIEDVLDKLRAAAAGQDGGILASEAGDDAVAIGPNADYRERLVSDKGLGDTDAFGRVVEHADEAGAVLYLDFDAGDDWLVELADDDAEVRDNLAPLEALGLSAWLDGETSHAVLKITTD